MTTREELLTSVREAKLLGPEDGFEKLSFVVRTLIDKVEALKYYSRGLKIEVDELNRKAGIRRKRDCT